MVQQIDACCETCDYCLHDYMRPEPGVYPDCPTCKTPLVRLWTASSVPTPHGDAVDIYVKHGICWPDGTPRRYTSKSEMKRVAKKLGLESHVEHVTAPDTDKNRHTTRWI